MGGAARRDERRRLALEPQPDRHARRRPGANSIFNSAVVPFGDGFAGVFRVDDTRRLMNLHAGRSGDGVDWTIDPEPISFTPADARVAELGERFEHAYDPRVTWLEDRYYVTWCNGYHGPTIGVAHTTDFGTFTSSTTPSSRSTGTASSSRVGSGAPTRCSAGRATAATRPSATSSTRRAPTSCTGAGTATSWRRCRSRGSRRRSEPGRRRSRRPRAGSSCTTACSRRATASSTRWARRCSTSTSRGASSPAGRDYLLAPQELYEQVGDVPNVVFPCAALVDAAADRVTIYYGGADTVVCMAHAHLSELLEFVRT